MSLFVACVKFEFSFPQNYATLYIMICSKAFLFKHSSMMVKNRYAKVMVMLASFPLLVQMGNLRFTK